MADYTVTLSTGSERQIDRARLAQNARVCALAHLPVTATKAEVAAADPALAAEFTNDISEYVKMLAKNAADGAKALADAADREKARAAFENVMAVGTSGQKNQLCQAIGLPNGSIP